MREVHRKAVQTRGGNGVGRNRVGSGKRGGRGPDAVRSAGERHAGREADGVSGEVGVVDERAFLHVDDECGVVAGLPVGQLRAEPRAEGEGGVVGVVHGERHAAVGEEASVHDAGLVASADVELPAPLDEDAGVFRRPVERAEIDVRVRVVLEVDHAREGVGRAGHAPGDVPASERGGACHETAGGGERVRGDEVHRAVEAAGGDVRPAGIALVHVRRVDVHDGTGGEGGEDVGRRTGGCCVAERGLKRGAFLHGEGARSGEPLARAVVFEGHLERSVRHDGVACVRRIPGDVQRPFAELHQAADVRRGKAVRPRDVARARIDGHGLGAVLHAGGIVVEERRVIPVAEGERAAVEDDVRRAAVADHARADQLEGAAGERGGADIRVGAAEDERARTDFLQGQVGVAVLGDVAVEGGVGAKAADLQRLRGVVHDVVDDRVGGRGRNRVVRGKFADLDHAVGVALEAELEGAGGVEELHLGVGEACRPFVHKPAGAAVVVERERAAHAGEVRGPLRIAVARDDRERRALRHVHGVGIDDAVLEPEDVRRAVAGVVFDGEAIPLHDGPVAVHHEYPGAVLHGERTCSQRRRALEAAVGVGVEGVRAGGLAVEAVERRAARVRVHVLEAYCLVAGVPFHHDLEVAAERHLRDNVAEGRGVGVEDEGIVVLDAYFAQDTFQSVVEGSHQFRLGLGEQFLGFVFELDALVHQLLQFLLPLQQDVLWKVFLPFHKFVELAREILLGTHHFLVVGLLQFLQTFHGNRIFGHRFQHLLITQVSEVLRLHNNPLHHNSCRVRKRCLLCHNRGREEERNNENEMFNHQ